MQLGRRDNVAPDRPIGARAQVSCGQRRHAGTIVSVPDEDPQDAEIRRLRAELQRMTEERDQALSQLGYAQEQINELRKKVPTRVKQAAAPRATLMDKSAERIYLTELITQCQYAIAAVERMNPLLAVIGSPAPPTNEVPEFFREAADLLQRAALASKLLWPPGGRPGSRERAERRGHDLRASLGLDSDGAHPLRSRTLRDHLEHYDERIDDWAAASPSRRMVDHLVGPRRVLDKLRPIITDSDVMRHFDPETKRFIFRGDAFDIQELVRAIEDVLGRAERRMRDLQARPTPSAP